MFCPKCGTKLQGNEDFCSKCGANLKESKEALNTNNSKTKPDFSKYKKTIIIASLTIVVIIVGIFIYSKLVGFEKLSWDESYLKANTKQITQTKLRLGVKLSNNDKIKDIKWATTCGQIDGEGLVITWDLSKITGKCEISASYKLKKIKRTVDVIPFNFQENELSLDYKIDEDSEEDLDFDGLTNKQEKEYKTNPEVADTDLDGLTDYYEIFESKTDPNKADTDGDGLNDYDEIQLGLDPLKADSKGDGIKDGQRELTYKYEKDNLSLTITGKGNIASTITEVNSNTKISSKKGLIDNLYTLYTDGSITEATLTITYTEEELKKYGLNEDNLSIYYYNEKETKYEKINSTIDKKNKKVTAKLKHFSNYVLGDSNLVSQTNTNQILFILDNSWSMYTNEQYKKYTGKVYTGGLLGLAKLDGFDSNGLRFTLTKQLVTKLSAKNYQIGLSEFREDYASALKIGSSAESIKKKLGDMTGKFITSDEGTNIGNALTSGINEFTKESDNKYIVILTDGQDSALNGQTKSIIEQAIQKNVKICSIGFGGGSYNTELSNISNGTGCKFYSSGNALGLSELFDNIDTEINDNLVDIDGDNKTDGILIADSGFIVNRDGFSFVNYRSNLSQGGHCYGMATVAELYYKKVLPLNFDSKTAKDATSYAYNLTNTYFKNYASLYDYKLKTNALKYSFGYDIFNEEQPSDFRVLNGTALLLNDKYKKEIEKTKIYKIEEEKSSLDTKSQIKKHGVSYKTFENIYLDEDSMQTVSIMKNDDTQIMNAIYATFISQNVTTHYSSSSDFMLWLRNVLKTEKTDYTGAVGFINILKTRLNDQDAPVIYSSFSGGLHAVNAISLVQDIDNPNLYYIGVYDNNYPGEKRYVNLECKKDTCVTKANNYYSSSNQPVRISPSLEYDLSYFNN